MRSEPSAATQPHLPFATTARRTTTWLQDSSGSWLPGERLEIWADTSTAEELAKRLALTQVELVDEVTRFPGWRHWSGSVTEHGAGRVQVDLYTLASTTAAGCAA